MPLERLRNFLWPVFVPLAFLWAVLMRVRRALWRRRTPRPVAVPVICFGNVHDGGTGKTPLVLACVRRFRDRRPVVVSRGYRGTASAGVESVDVALDGAARRYGDEPVLLAARGVPVVVGRDRRAAIGHAVQHHGAGWAVLDDGFQRLSVPKSFAAVVLPADRSPWSAWCWPAGSLREPLSALRDADALIVTVWPGEEAGAAEWEKVVQQIAPAVPLYRVEGRVEGLRDAGTGIEATVSGPLAALCGIGAPDRFFRTVRTFGPVVHEAAFGDHHAFTADEIRRFDARAREAGATALVTTSKDWPRLASLTRHIALPVRVVEIGYEVPETLWQDLERRVQTSAPPR